MNKSLDQQRYEYAPQRVEELLPLVGEDTPANDPLALELAIMSEHVIAYEKEYDVELAATGLDKEDFKVHVDADNNLHIEMERKAENKEGKHPGRYLRREFSYEKFQQTLLLPDDVDADKIEASVEKGVLNVHLPKKDMIQRAEAVKHITVK